MKQETTVSKREVYTGKYFSVDVYSVELEKGYAQREIVDHKGTIVFLGFTKDKKILFKKNYRKSIEKTCLEILTEKVDITKSHIDIVKNGILSPLGIKLNEIDKIYEYYPSVKYSNEKVTAYFGEIEVENEEILKEKNILVLSLDDIFKDEYKEQIVDGNTIICIDYIKENINKLGE